MNIAWNRRINIALNAFIVLSAIIFAHVFLIGGFEARIFGGVPRIGKVKPSFHNPTTPFLVLLAFLLLKPILVRPAPFARLHVWLGAHRRTILLGMLVTAAAAFPRFWDLGGNSLAPDELDWITYGRRVVTHLRAHQFKESTRHLYYPGVMPAAAIGASVLYLGKGASPFSHNLIDPLTAARLPVALLGTLTCLLLYLFACILIGDATAFWAAMLLSLYPEEIALSRMAHVDSTLTLFFTSSLLCYSVYGELLRLRWKIASAVFFGLSLLAKATAAIIPLLLIVWKLAARLHDRRGKLRFLEASDCAWLAIGLALYFTLFTKLWYEPGELPWIGYARFLPSLAALAGPIDRIASFPWLLTLAALACSYAALAAGRVVRYGARGLTQLRPTRLVSSVLLILLCGAFIEVFRKPIINQLFFTCATYCVGKMGHIKYWMGDIVTSPPRWFYFYMLMARMPPLVIAFLMCGILRSCRAVRRKEQGWATDLMCLLAPAVMVGFMSFGHKKAIRYIEPAIPFLCLLAAAGITGALNALSKLGIAKGRLVAFRAMAGLLIIACVALPLIRTFPDCAVYVNVLIGGPAGASERMQLGVGVGTKEAVRYLKAHAGEGDSIFTFGISGEFRYHWQHDEPRAAHEVFINDAMPPYADWAVVPLSHRRINPQIDKMLQTYAARKCHSVTRCGVDFVDIYRFDGPTSVAP
jgi:4-amino-4-deoxy-L-arabinose transferase-like glycosyltransferase